MTNRVSAIEYDTKWEIVAKAAFPFVEDAQAWCEARAAASGKGPLNWGDTQIGLEGNTDGTITSLDAFGDYKEGEPIFQIQAIEDGDIESCAELQTEDWRNQEDAWN